MLSKLLKLSLTDSFISIIINSLPYLIINIRVDLTIKLITILCIISMIIDLIISLIAILALILNI